jgi:hypothetical protein
VAEWRTEGYDIRSDVLPIVVAKREGYPTPKGFKGTGFLLGKHVFVTCHHCVAEPVGKADTYAVALPIEYAPQLRNDVPDAKYFISPLRDIEQDPTGLDLATARVGRDPVGLRLAEEGVRTMGEDVSTYGYPLTEDLPHPEEGRAITLNGRYLKGYSTCTYLNDVPGYRPTPTEELNMPAPRGLSGAPLIRMDSLEVIGVVYGTKDTGTVEEFSRVDEATGERRPELQRITTFAVAHMFDSLYNLSGRATEGMPLGEYLRS